MQQIQAVLKEVGSKKGLQSVQGNGIRKLLWKYVHGAMINVLFTLSPSETNLNSTRSTFRIAEAMTHLQITLVKIAQHKSKDALIAEMKIIIRKKEAERESTQFELDDLRQHKQDLAQLRQEIAGMIHDIEQAENGDIGPLQQDLDDVDREIQDKERGIVELSEFEKYMSAAVRRHSLKEQEMKAAATVIQRNWRRVNRKKERSREQADVLTRLQRAVQERTLEQSSKIATLEKQIVDLRTKQKQEEFVARELEERRLSVIEERSKIEQDIAECYESTESENERILNLKLQLEDIQEDIEFATLKMDGKLAQPLLSGLSRARMKIYNVGKCSDSAVSKSKLTADAAKAHFVMVRRTDLMEVKRQIKNVKHHKEEIILDMIIPFVDCVLDNYDV